MKQGSSLDVGKGFQGMFVTVGIGILLGSAVGVFCGLAGRKNPRVYVAEWVMDGCWWSDSGNVGRSVLLRRRG